MYPSSSLRHRTIQSVQQQNNGKLENEQCVSYSRGELRNRKKLRCNSDVCFACDADDFINFSGGDTPVNDAGDHYVHAFSAGSPAHENSETTLQNYSSTSTSSASSSSSSVPVLSTSVKRRLFADDSSSGNSAITDEEPHVTGDTVNSFKAVRLTKGDYLTRHYYEESVQVQVDVSRRLLIIDCGKPYYLQKRPDQSPEPKSAKQEDNLLVIPWDRISGIDFQYSPLQPVLVVIELDKKPEIAPRNFKSVVYFLYCSKVDCAKYLDELLLSNDPRLLTLAIKSMPTWSVVVNRFNIPLYYSHRVRHVITMIVNIYIIVSLIWGFYDLYKNLPFVGNAMRTIFGPVARLLEPLKNNKLVLLLPLAIEGAWGSLIKFFSIFAPIVKLKIWGVLGSQIGSLFRALTPLLNAIDAVRLSVVNGVMFWVNLVWDLIWYPVYLISSVFGFIRDIFTTIRNAFVWLWELSKIGSFITNTRVVIGWIWTGQMEILAYAITVLSNTVTLIISPFSKLKSLFTFGQAVQSAQVISQTATLAAETAATVKKTSEIKEYIEQVKEGVKPVSSAWAGINRIILWIQYTYHDKIKHRSQAIQRILIFAMITSVLTGLAITIYLVFYYNAA